MRRRITTALALLGVLTTGCAGDDGGGASATETAAPTGTDAHNTEDDLIANPAEGAADEGHWVRAVVDATGQIELTNGRNGHTRVYQAR